MRRFGVLLRKELLELLTPQMLVPLLIAVVIFMFIGDVVGSEQEKAAEGRAVALMDLDRSATSNSIVEALRQGGFDVIEIEGEAVAPEDIVADSPGSTTMVIPAGFEASLGTEDVLAIGAHTRIDSFSMSGIEEAGQLRGILASINDSLSDTLLAEALPGEDPSRLKQPVRLAENVVVGGQSMEGPPEAVEGFIIQQTLLVPMVLFIVILFSAQTIATTIAAEKENKTLETLLASPISRGALVSAKMLAAAIVALLSAGVYMYAMQRYMTGISGGEISANAGSDVVAKLGLGLGAGEYALVGLTLFLGILCALAIALILGSFADSVRAVGAIMAPLMILLIIPYLLVLFLDFDSLSPALRLFVLANPFSYPFVAMPNLMLGKATIVYWGIAYQALWFVVFVLIAARVFSSDRILTMRLRFGRSRR